MQPTTLRGIFPERPVPHRRNFIRENVLRIKTLQQADLRAKSDPNAAAAKTQAGRSLSKLRMHEDPSLKTADNKPQGGRVGIQKVEISPTENRVPHISDLVVDNNISHRSMQTSPIDVVPEDSAVHTNIVSTKKSARRRNCGFGDVLDNTKAVTSPSDGNCQQPDIGEANQLSQQVNFIRNNILALKAGRTPKKSLATSGVIIATESPNSAVPPKKTLPAKRMKETKKQEEAEYRCPPGHVLLPEDERKDTLRVLRESYAEKIQELNSMPVRSDTLKMQRRKIELESELKKIDEGIKIFARPVVFVKV